MIMKSNATKMAVFTLASALCFGLIAQARALWVDGRSGNASDQLGISENSNMKNLPIPSKSGILSSMRFYNPKGWSASAG